MVTMRILQIIPSISLVYGGPSQMVLGLSAALSAQGIEVTIITTDSNGDIGQLPLNVPLINQYNKTVIRLFISAVLPSADINFRSRYCSG